MFPYTTSKLVPHLAKRLLEGPSTTYLVRVAQQILEERRRHPQVCLKIKLYLHTQTFTFKIQMHVEANGHGASTVKRASGHRRGRSHSNDRRCKANE